MHVNSEDFVEVVNPCVRWERHGPVFEEIVNHKNTCELVKDQLEDKYRDHSQDESYTEST